MTATRWLWAPAAGVVGLVTRTARVGLSIRSSAVTWRTSTTATVTPSTQTMVSLSTAGIWGLGKNKDFHSFSFPFLISVKGERIEEIPFISIFKPS